MCVSMCVCVYVHACVCACGCACGCVCVRACMSACVHLNVVHTCEIEWMCFCLKDRLKTCGPCLCAFSEMLYVDLVYKQFIFYLSSRGMARLKTVSPLLVILQQKILKYFHMMVM